MSYTIGQCLVDAITFIIKNPRVITILIPKTRRKARTAYNAENSPLDFDTDLRSKMRQLDSQYLAYNDTDLQAMIEEALPLDQTINFPEDA